MLIADQYRQMFDPQTPRNMAAIYSTFDVLLNASAGEGFGIPMLEARPAASRRSSPTSRR